MTIVIRPSTGTRAGVVGDDQGAALGRDVLDAAHLDAEPLLRDRAQRGDQEALGDLGVEAVLVDDVVAGDPTAQERQELGEPGLPVVAEDLAGGVWKRGQPVGRPGCRGSLGRAGRRGGRGARLLELDTMSVRRRLDRLVDRLPAARSRAGSTGGLLARRATFLAPGPRQVAGGRGRLLLVRAAAGSAAGADRDDLGVTHGRAPPRQAVGDAPASTRSGEASRPGEYAAGAEGGAEVGERLGGGVRRLEAELGAHPGGVHPATIGQELHLLGGEVGEPAPSAAPSRSPRPRSRAAAATAARAGGSPGTA